MSPTLRNSGHTLIELLVTMVILCILAVGVLPLSEMALKRTKEIQLRENLRIIRNALDEHKRLADEGKIAVDAFSSGYPKTLDVLIEGVEVGGGPEPYKKRLLRKLPRDPMAEDGEWGLRSYADDPDSDVWGGQDVYDVFSKSDREALDGTKYREW
jgi:general secretion pathway protein G